MPVLLTEPRRPAVIRENPRGPWFAVGSVCVGAFMGQLDASIVTLAFPALGREFHTGLAAVEWASLAYLLTLVGLLAAAGRLSDVLGRKLIYLYGFVVFTAASAACGLAPTLGLLVLFRVVQAAGAAMLQANSVAILLVAALVARSRPSPPDLTKGERLFPSMKGKCHARRRRTSGRHGRPAAPGDAQGGPGRRSGQPALGRPARNCSPPSPSNPAPAPDGSPAPCASPPTR